MIKRYLLRVFILCSLLLPVFNASAGSTYTGTDIRVYCSISADSCFVRLLTPRTNPACGNPQYYIFNNGHPVWKNQFALATTAQAAGKPIFILGTGTCEFSAVAETIEQLDLLP